MFASQEFIANGGGDRHVGSRRAAGVLRGRGGRAAVAVRVGVAPDVPKRLSLAFPVAPAGLPLHAGRARVVSVAAGWATSNALSPEGPAANVALKLQTRFGC